MSLRSLSRLRKTIGVRISFTHSIILILIGLALFAIAHLLLSSKLAKRDQDSIQSELNFLAEQYKRNGLEAIQKEIAHQFGDNEFFVRIARANITLLSSDPKDFADFDLSQLPMMKSKDRWIRIQEKEPDRFDFFNSADVLEITSLRLADGNLLQVGKSSQYRGDVLERFHLILVIILVPLLLSVGTLLSFRMLRPLRSMIATVKSIQAGQMNSRVPTIGKGDELDELARLFNGMLEKIEKLVLGIQDSLDNVAHDLRTPITRLRAAAEEALQSEPNEDTYREALADCMEETDVILTMLDTLMDISEAETGSMKLKLQNVSVPGLLENTAGLYHYVAEEKGIAIDTQCVDNLQVVADPGRIRQVLVNLVDNAVKYTDTGGKVVLEAHQSDSEVIIQVSDTGTGIPPQELPHIWERLYRGSEVRSKRGTGLGLSLVRAIVAAHGGKVEATSQAGHGSIFKIHIPLIVPQRQIVLKI